MTASSSNTLSFVDNASSVVFDGTYKQYVFKFIDIHAVTENANFSFQTDTGTNTSYNMAYTQSSFFRQFMTEMEVLVQLVMKQIKI